MQAVMKQIEKVNGSGWFIGLIINIIWTTLAIGGLYWVLHEDVAILKVRQAAQLEATREIREELELRGATKQELRALWDQGQEQHARMWDSINRKQDRTKGWSER